MNLLMQFAKYVYVYYYTDEYTFSLHFIRFVFWECDFNRPIASDIRDVAFDVNDRLKNLILPEDDDDITTDIEDRVQGFTGPRLSPPSRRKAAADETGPTTGRGGGGGALGIGGQPQSTTSKSSPKLAPKHSPKVATKVPKLVTPANTAAAASTTTTPATDAASGQSSQLSPKTGQSSPKTGQKEEGSSPSGDITTPISILDLSPESPKLHLLSVLGVLIPHTKYAQQESRMESLRWLMWLHQQLPKRVSGELA